MTLTISVVASILVIGALIASPGAYSTNDNDELDECSCEKPDTLKVKFNAPVAGDFKIEIYKKFDDRNDPKKLPLQTFFGVPQATDEDSHLVISAIMFGKDKLESNTAFVVYKVEVDSVSNVTEEIVAEMEIHTSCSKPLFVGKTVMDNQYSIEVLEGTKGGNPSIPIDEPLTCEDKKPKKMGSITIKKALTNDNGGTAKFEDFTITVTNVDITEETTEETTVDIDPLLGIGVKDLPAGTYKLNEILPDPSKGTYTTVLIAGDTGCPSMLGEVFTIKKNKNLSCTIYNDDNFDSSTGGTGGIVFQNKSLQILIDPNHDGDTVVSDSLDSCSVEPRPDPCIEILDKLGSQIAIVDSSDVASTTIVLFSVFADVTESNPMSSEPACDLEQLISHSVITGDEDDTILAIVLACSDINSGTIYNVNYVLINPTI